MEKDAVYAKALVVKRSLSMILWNLIYHLVMRSVNALSYGGTCMGCKAPTSPGLLDLVHPMYDHLRMLMARP